MTAKRFKLMKEFNGFNDIYDGETLIGCERTVYAERIVDLLNELDSRNKRLEEKIQRERTSFTKTHERWSKEAEIKIKELSDENWQLKKELFELKKDYIPNYVMLAIGCLMVGASQIKGMIPDFWIGSVLCIGIIIIVWSILWNWR